LFKIIWKPKAARQIEKIKNRDLRKIIFKSVEQLVNFPEKMVNQRLLLFLIVIF